MMSRLYLYLREGTLMVLSEILYFFLSRTKKWKEEVKGNS